MEQVLRLAITADGKLDKLVREKLSREVVLSVVLEEKGVEVVSQQSADGEGVVFLLASSGCYNIKVALVHEREGKLPQVELDRMEVVKERLAPGQKVRLDFNGSRVLDNNERWF
jgi:hypothetical protein